MSQEILSISRDGQVLGTWSAADIQRMLQGGVLSATDYFWQEGMAEWNTLDQFVPPQPVGATFPVTFGSAWAVDQLGFVRTGEVRLTATSVEYVGQHLWPGWVRVLVFLVATAAGWFILGSITSAIPYGGGVLLSVFAVAMGLFTLVGTPLLVLTLLPFFCASAASQRMDLSAITGVNRRGRGISFLVAHANEPRRARFRAGDQDAAREIESWLRRTSTPPVDRGERVAPRRPQSIKQPGPIGCIATGAALLASLGVFAVLAFYVYSSWHPPQGPLPPAARAALQAYVENDGRQPVTENVFSMPGANLSAPPPAGDLVKVRRIRYLYPIQVRQPGGQLPPGTVVQCYEVGDTRTLSDGTEKSETRLFYAYPDAAGAWQFMENPSPYGSARVLAPTQSAPATDAPRPDLLPAPTPVAAEKPPVASPASPTSRPEPTPSPTTVAMLASPKPRANASKLCLH